MSPGAALTALEETKAERAIERQIDCMLAVALAWRGYLQFPDESERFAAARLLYGYTMAQLDGAGSTYVDRALRAQLPMMDGAPLPKPPRGFAAGTVSRERFLASPDQHVSSTVLLTTIRDRWAARLAALASGDDRAEPMPPDWAKPTGELFTAVFGNQVYYYGEDKWKSATRTGMCLHVLGAQADADPRPASADVAYDGNGQCFDLAYDAWWHYRVYGDQADYDAALLALRYGFDRVNGEWPDIFTEMFP